MADSDQQKQETQQTQEPVQKPAETKVEVEVKKSRRPAATAFKQQQLKAWQPILTPKVVIPGFFIVGVIFLALGIALTIASNQVVEASKRYDHICNGTSTCRFSIEIEEEMKSPVYLYYQLDNFYQNHRRYVKSRNDDQLRGVKVTSFADLVDCEPRKSERGSKKAQDFFLPCGLIAWSLFNDTFRLQNASTEADIPLRKNGIAWASDVGEKFNNPPEDTRGIRVIPDFEDEDFIVWMRTAGLPNFRKLHRIIDQDLPKGNYVVLVEDNFPVSAFDGKKYVVLSTTSWIGGKNLFLGVAYLVVGCISIVQAIVFVILRKLFPRKLGDVRYLDWNK